jgi:hypothetical protein
MVSGIYSQPEERLPMNALDLIKQAYIYLGEQDILNYFLLMSPDVELYQTEALP